MDTVFISKATLLQIKLGANLAPNSDIQSVTVPVIGKFWKALRYYHPIGPTLLCYQKRIKSLLDLEASANHRQDCTNNKHIMNQVMTKGMRL